MKNIIYILLLSALSVNAQASGGGGVTIANGGQSAICLDGNEIKSFEAFDLYEGRVVHGYKYPKVSDPLETALAMAAKIDKALGSAITQSPGNISVARRVALVADQMTILAPGQQLKHTGDSREFKILPEGCSLIPTINFYDWNLIHVNGDAWAQLSNLNKAALYLHEGLYWYLRQSGAEKDSRRTRKIVSYVMSGRSLSGVEALPESAPERIQYCSGKGTKFWAYRNAKGQLALQFAQIAGYHMVARTTMAENVDFALPELPLDPRNARGKVVSMVNSPIDNEMVLQLAWGRGLVTLSGTIQYKTPFSVPVKCEEINY